MICLAEWFFSKGNLENLSIVVYDWVRGHRSDKATTLGAAMLTKARQVLGDFMSALGSVKALVWGETFGGGDMIHVMISFKDDEFWWRG